VFKENFVRFYTWLAVLLLGLMLALTGCGGAGNGETEDTSPMIFRVGDETVTVNDFEQRVERELGPIIAQLLAQGSTVEEVQQEAQQFGVRQAVLDNMIQEELLLYAAREEGLGVDAETIDETVEQQMAMQAGAEEEEQDAAAAQATQTALRQELTEQQLIREVIASHTSADMFNSKHILVEDEETAEEVVEQLEAGEDFAELAAEYSQDPGSAETGGSYGWVARGSFVPEYEEAAFSAELNEPVIVQSQFGYHVIVVEDREMDRTFESFEELQSVPNFQNLLQQSFEPWYQEYREQAREEGVLEIDEEFDPTSVPLPIPDPSEIPTTPPALEMMPTPGGEEAPPADTEGEAAPETDTEPTEGTEAEPTATPAS
jgi:parvulin-like peptidyl-prolyl isomerase